MSGGDEGLTFEVYYLKDGSQAGGSGTPAAGDAAWEQALKVKDVADSGTYWYKVVITGSHADDYAPYIQSADVKITPAELTVTGEPESFSKVYDGGPDVSENLLSDISVSAQDVTGESITVSSATGAYEDKNADTGKDVTLSLTLSGVDNWGNYQYNDTPLTEGKIEVEKPGAGTISPKPVTVTGGVSATDRVYNGLATVELTGTPTTANGAFLTRDRVSFGPADGKTGTMENADADEDKDKKVTVSAETLAGLLTGDDARNYTVETPYETTVTIDRRKVVLLFPNGNDGTTTMTAPYSPSGLTVAHPEVYQVSARTADGTTGFVDTDQLAADDIQYTFTDNQNEPVQKPTDVGTYTVKAELTETAAAKWGNYTIDAITGRVEIQQATEDLNVVIRAEDGLTYTGWGQDPIASLAVTGGSETLTENNGYTIAFRLGDSGDYDLSREQLTAALVDATEYTVSWQVTTTNYGDKTGQFKVTISPAELTLSSSVTTKKVYDGGMEAEVTGERVGGVQKQENIRVTQVSAVYDSKDEGTGKTITTTYTLTFGTGVDPANYKVSARTVEKAENVWTVEVTRTDGEITAKPITVTILNKEKTYDGVAPAVNSVQGTDWTVPDGAIIIGDNLGITLTVTDAQPGVGDYHITGTRTNTNYEVTFQGQDSEATHGIFTVKPRPISVKIGDAWGYYGNKPVLTLGDGNGQVTLTPATETDPDRGLVSGENIYDALDGLTLTTTADAQSDVDNRYTISASGGTGDQSNIYGNYQVTFTDGTYTVEKRPVTITLTDQSSNYGAIPSVKQDAFTVSAGDDAVVRGDLNNGLTITLNVYETGTDPIDSATPAEDYNIVPTAGGDKADNYTITWAGNGDTFDGGQYGQYTVEEAELRISYPGPIHSVAMGGSVNWPLGFYNVSNGNAQLNEKPADVTVEYTSSKPDVATVDENGNVTIKTTGTTTITATVTAFGDNYKAGTDTASYELTVVQGGQGIQVDVRANTLTYTGEPQALVTTQIIYPLSGVTVEYQLNTDQGEYTSGIPKGTNAGRYEVYWKASYPGLATIYGSEPVTIQKADPSTGFTPSSVSTEYAEGKVFDSTTETSLNIHKKYQNETGWSITYLSNDTRIAEVKDNDLHKIHLNGNTGDVRISAGFAKTDNFNAQTVYFTLTVNEAGTTIEYDAKDYSVPYDGQPYGARITVRDLTNYTIKYSADDGTSYTLDESPTVTNVSEGTLTIYFQIQADGYPSQNGQQKVTITPRPIAEGMGRFLILFIITDFTTKSDEEPYLI